MDVTSYWLKDKLPPHDLTNYQDNDKSLTGFRQL